MTGGEASSTPEIFKKEKNSAATATTLPPLPRVRCLSVLKAARQFLNLSDHKSPNPRHFLVYVKNRDPEKNWASTSDLPITVLSAAVGRWLRLSHPTSSSGQGRSSRHRLPVLFSATNRADVCLRAGQERGGVQGVGFEEGRREEQEARQVEKWRGCQGTVCASPGAVPLLAPHPFALAVSALQDLALQLPCCEF